jgi:hypothetical protein
MKWSNVENSPDAFLTSRCVVWDLAEVEAWIEERRRASDAASIQRAPTPDVRKRKTRPVQSPVSGRPCPAKGLTEWYNSSEAYSEVLLSMAGGRWNFCCTKEGNFIALTFVNFTLH